MIRSELCEIYSAANAQEAHLVAAALENAGITARVVESGLQNAVGELPASAIAPRVWIHCENIDRARTILDSIRIPDPSELQGTQWTCPKCGELNAASFDLCWNCQTERPATE